MIIYYFGTVFLLFSLSYNLFEKTKQHKFLGFNDFSLIIILLYFAFFVQANLIKLLILILVLILELISFKTRINSKLNLYFSIFCGILCLNPIICIILTQKEPTFIRVLMGLDYIKTGKELTEFLIDLNNKHPYIGKGAVGLLVAGASTYGGIYLHDTYIHGLICNQNSDLSNYTSHFTLIKEKILISNNSAEHTNALLENIKNQEKILTNIADLEKKRILFRYTMIR